MVFQNNVLSGAAGSGTTTYAINQSIRFDDAAEHFMYSPTPSSSKDFSTTCTISFWFKIGNIKQGYLAGAFYGSNARYNLIQINASGQLQENGRVGGASTSTGSGGTEWATTRIFRDPSAWYHAVFVWDTTNAVQSERFKLYINGVRETDFATSPSFGASELVYWFGKSSYTTLGAYFNGTGYGDTLYWDGYLAEMHGVDGTALDQDSFGEFNSSGIWTPKEYTGSHGTDGFYIKGADASDLGINSAANGNDFTLNAISSHDKMLDSPTNNFAVLNPLNIYGSNVALAEGNLKSSASSTANDRGAKATQGATSGKWYFEVYFAAGSADNNGGVGVSGSSEYNDVPGETSDPEGFRYGDFGSFKQNGSATTIQSVSQGDVMMVAFDVDNSKAWFGKNGTFFSSGDPAGGNNPLTTTVPDLCLPASYHYNYVATTIFNFGQEGTFAGNVTAGGNSDANGIGNFKYSVPSGYLALCTKNLGS